MPVYPYKCACGAEFQRSFPTISDGAEFALEHPCDQCQGTAKRLFTPTNFRLWGKADGYYKPSPTAPRIVEPDKISFSGKDKHDYVK